MKTLTTALFLTTLLALPVSAQDMPHLEKNDGHFAMVVDGKPFFVLGAQIHNSSSWPGALDAAWPTLEALHVNTVEAPVYWEQLESTRNNFNFSGVDLLITQARDHHVHLVLLWFGTWKNGQNHYVPEWIKSDTKQYPREETAGGKLLDVMSPHSPANLAADAHAFAALMRHVKAFDGMQHTVIMVQVENESGSVGSVRDFSPAAQKLFEASVPPELTRALHLPSGTWQRTFGPDADEDFAAYATAHYINEVAKAGKAEYPTPMYCNVWITYPVHALETRNKPSPGQEYPSGGPQQRNIRIWKIAASSIDILAPDYYATDTPLYREVLATYNRPDNPLFIPETHLDSGFGRNLFYALGSGAIGFSPFGVDHSSQSKATDAVRFTEDYALLQPIAQQIAEFNLEGKLQTAVEERGSARQTLHFGDIDAIISFGFPQSDGVFPPGTPDVQGRALIAQLGPTDFLVTGFDASVSFRLVSVHNSQLEILRAEEGRYIGNAWQSARILNGDETDRGLNFHGLNPTLARVRLHTIPLYDEQLHHPPTP